MVSVVDQLFYVFRYDLYSANLGISLTGDKVCISNVTAFKYPSTYMILSQSSNS